MVAVVVRELGPLVTALLVLARRRTAIVIDLSTQPPWAKSKHSKPRYRSNSLPRVRACGALLFPFSALTVYLIIISLVAGYAFAFIQECP